MPDITLPFTFADAATSSGAQVARNFYDPAVAPDSFEVLDGWLTNANRQAGWTIRSPLIRPGGMADGRMVGLTANADYTSLTFPDVVTDNGAYVVIPGASQTFVLPWTPTIVMAAWHVVTTTTQSDFAAVSTRLAVFIDSTRIASSTRVTPAAGFPHNLFRDRIYSGHWSSRQAGAPSMTRGPHTLSVRIFIPGNTTTPQMTRCRTRHMSVLWWR